MPGKRPALIGQLYFKHSVRYDYFETPITIKGQRYIVALDVEVASINRMRTYRIENIDLVPLETVPGLIPGGRNHIEQGYIKSIPEAETKKQPPNKQK